MQGHVGITNYRMAGNLFWRIGEISVFGGIYFGGLAWQSLCHNDIHSNMANPDEQS